jgi:hypothetical protein
LWDSMSAQPLASDRAIASGYLDAARRRTGASQWRSAWHRGQAMGIQEAVTHALGKRLEEGAPRPSNVFRSS